MKFRNTEHREHIALQMTPMIDIVFQLLVFFLFTFKIVLPEGDFNVRMPSAQTTQASQPSETPLLKVRLRANDDGSLAGVQLGDRQLSGESPFGQLHQQIRALVDDAGGPGTAEQEVEIDADYHLRYEYTMRAITAIVGYLDANDERHTLVEKVRFAPLSENR